MHYLPDITTPDRIGRVSGYGWSLGYAGGLLAMFVSLIGLDLSRSPLVWLFTKDEWGKYPGSEFAGSRLVRYFLQFHCFFLLSLFQQPGSQCLFRYPRQFYSTERYTLKEITEIQTHCFLPARPFDLQRWHHHDLRFWKPLCHRHISFFHE